MGGLIKLRTLQQGKWSFCAFMSINCKSNATNWKSNNEKTSCLVYILLQSKENWWKVGEWKINCENWSLSAWLVQWNQIDPFFSAPLAKSILLITIALKKRFFFHFYHRLGIKEQKQILSVMKSHGDSWLSFCGIFSSCRDKRNFAICSEAIVCTYDNAAKLPSCGNYRFQTLLCLRHFSTRKKKNREKYIKTTSRAAKRFPFFFHRFYLNKFWNGIEAKACHAERRALREIKVFSTAVER